MKLLKIVGLTIAVLGCIALVIVAAPVVRGQVVQRERPAFDLYLNGMLQGSRLGIGIRDVDAADVKREKLDAQTGAAVDEVAAGSAAEKAGIKAGDVVVSFDGERVRSARHLARLVDETPDGREVEATVVRNGERMSLKVTPASERSWLSLQGPGNVLRQYSFQAPERFDLNLRNFDTREFGGELRNRLRPFFFTDGRARLGIGVEDLTEQLGAYFGAGTGGVLVTEVDDGTPARTGGLRAGDVITRVNEQQVRNTDELRRRLADVTGDVRIGIVRDRKEQTLTVKLDELEAPRRRIVRRVV